MKPIADTPLARALRHLGINQLELAARLNMLPSSVSRIVRHGKMSRRMAVKILQVVPGLAVLIDERHLLLADFEPYKSWKPDGNSTKVPRESTGSQLAGAGSVSGDAPIAS